MNKNITSLSTSILVSFSLVLSSLAPLSQVQASFNPGLIISDQAVFNANTMTAEEIQLFLEDHKGVLKNHVDVDIDGLVKTAAMIIYSAAERHQINPQILLIKLQKEMGLITDDTPKQSQFDWAMGYGVCDSCSVDHPNVLKFKGFAKQIDNAAEFMAYVPVNEDRFFYKSGETYTISGEEVTIQNSVTAALYNYTPHIHGNKIFSKLWESWFMTTLSHPNGSLLQAFGEPGVWLVKDGQKHAFTNLASLTSRYSVDQIIQVPKATIDQYEKGPSISFPEYSLVQTESGNTYLIVNSKLRLIVDDQTMRHLGFFEDEIEVVAATDLAFFSQGLPITMASLDPTGALVQDPTTAGIFYVQDGIKYPLVAPELLALQFSHLTVRQGTIEELAAYDKGSPILLDDGFLVKSRDVPTVYVIANGKKHEIDSEATFNSLGYKWTNIHIVSESLLILHPTAETLSVSTNLSDEEASELVDSELAL